MQEAFVAHSHSRTFSSSIALMLMLVLGGCAPRVDNRPIDPASYPGVIRIACAGDSITACGGCWPGKLERMLNEKWKIANFGIGGATILNFGDKPYVVFKLPEVIQYEPDVVLLLLGTNDSKPRHWYYKKEIEEHYGQLIDTLKNIPSHPRIWVCLPPPAFPGQWGIDNGRILEMQPLLKKVAKRKGVPVIDLYTPLNAHPEFFPDQVHPDDAGASIIAREIYRALTGQETPSSQIYGRMPVEDGTTN